MKTFLYFIIFGSAGIYSRDIYTSINWDPRNPMWVFGFLCSCETVSKGFLRTDIRNKFECKGMHKEAV